MGAPRYKIRIIRTSIGDPFLLVQFQFEVPSGYTDPATTPVENMGIVVDFSLTGESNSFQQFGVLQLKKPIANWQPSGSDGAHNYYFGLPFDPGSGYNQSDDPSIYLKIYFTCTNGTIILNDGNDNHSTYTMNYQDPPVYVDGFNAYYTT
jgi:hypothetical protein